MNGIFFFILLPYMAIVSLIFGSIYRYRFHGFQVSSLSSQLLENKLLFFGSRPFHWGIIVLFFGHLTAFLIPASVLAWNGKPYVYIFLKSLHLLSELFFYWTYILIIRRIQVKRIRCCNLPGWISLFILYFCSNYNRLIYCFFLQMGIILVCPGTDTLPAVGLCFLIPTSQPSLLCRLW